jgi:hypothetical protein
MQTDCDLRRHVVLSVPRCVKAHQRFAALQAAAISALPTKKTVAEKEAKPAKPLKAPEPEEWIIDIPELLTALDLYATRSLSHAM